MSTTAHNQIAFVDTQVADYQTLVSAFDPSTEVILIDGGDGLQKMADALAGCSGLDAIHILSHGSAGALLLGDTTLDSANLNTHAALLAQIGNSLTADGDLLLYGCNVAQGAAGQAFVESIAKITQADVAASNDLTGSAALDGNWVLEAVSGNVETPRLAALDFAGVLSPSGSPVYDFEGPTTTPTAHEVDFANGGHTLKVTDVAGTASVTVDTTQLNADGVAHSSVHITGTDILNGTNKINLSFTDSQQFYPASVKIFNPGNSDITVFATTPEGDANSMLATAGQWSTILINADSNFRSSSVNLEFQNVSGTQADIYLDDFTVDFPPSINYLNGDNVTVVQGNSVLIDASNINTGIATITDSDAANFDAGYLLITGMSGITADGTFTTDHNVVKFGSDVGGASPVPTSQDHVYVFTVGGWVDIGTVDIGQIELDGQNGSNLRIEFNASATPGYASLILQSLYYAAATPGTRVFNAIVNDGAGGTSSEAFFSVEVTAANPPPTISGIPGSAQAVTTGIAAALDDFTVADADNDNLTVTLTATNGTINNLTDADTGTAGIQLTGTAASINTAIAGATFTATNAGAASIGISVSDGIATPVTDTYNLTATTPVNAFADLNGDTQNWGGINTSTTIDNNGAPATVSHADPSLTHWNGATLTVQRATADQNKTADIYGFSTSGALFTVNGANLQSSGQTFATFTSANGVLSISFANGGANASNAQVNDVLQHITYRNDTPYGDATLRFTMTDAAGSATADVTMSATSIFVDNTTDTATIDRSNGVSFSEAIAIAAADTSDGFDRIYLGAGLQGQTVSMSAATTLGENLVLNYDNSTSTTLAGGTLTIGAGKTLSFASGVWDTLDVQGVLAGAGNLSFNAANYGTVTLSGANTYSGTTMLNRGTLAITNQANLGTTSSITLYANTNYDATLQLLGSSGTINSNIVTTLTPANRYGVTYIEAADTASTHTLSGTISGTGQLNAIGNGTLVLTGTDTYSGDTAVGNTYVNYTTTLQVDGSIANTASVFVNAQATLQGTGSIGTVGTKGAVTINTGGTLAAAGANSVGTLTLNDGLNLIAGSYLKADLTGTTAGSGYDQVVVKDAVDVTGANLDINLGSYVPNTNDSFVLIDNDGNDVITGQVKVGGVSLAEGDSFVVGSKVFTISYLAGSGNDLGITVINPVNALKNLDTDSVAWAGVGNTVALDAGANASTGHLDPTATHWNGATLTVQRSGTAVTSDVLAIEDAGASFTASGGILQSGGQTFGTYTSANGVLSISLTGSATDASNALVADLLHRITYRNDTPAGNATLHFALTPASASAVTADTTVTTDKIYVTTGTDTASDNLNDGVAFSEALRIANNQAGTDTLVLKSTLANQTVSATNATSLSGNVIVDGDAASGATISNGTLNTNDNTLTLTNGSGDTLSVSTTLTGNGSVAKTGAGTATLSGTNTYSGTTSVTGGKIVANSSSSLGTSAVTLDAGTLGFGATFNWTIANNITLGAGGGTLASAFGNNGGTTTVSGVISGGNLTLTSGDMSFSNPPNGVVYLTGANTYTGTTTVALNSGTGIAKIDGDANLGSGDIIFTSGRLSITGNTTINNAIQASGANASFIVASGTTTEITGVISGNNGLVSGGSGGTLKLNATNTYSGSTYSGTGNTIIASTDASLPDGTQLELGGGNLTLLSNQTVGALNPFATTNSASVIDLGTFNLTLGSISNSNFIGAINGSGNLVKNGSGTFTIGSSNATATGGNYSGTTTVNGGALQLDGTLKGNIVVASGGKLSGGGADSSAGEALGSATVQSGGTLSPGASGGTTTTADLNTGALTVASGGTLAVTLGGTTAGANSGGYDQVAVTGTVNITGATLSATAVGGFVPVAGDVFTIVANDSTDAITGTFNGLAEGATVTVSGTPLKLSYVGGTGNDITLTTQLVFSNVHISADTGITTDFITNTAAQTVTATLSANVPSGMTIWGSVDNGSNWTDISNKVSGMSLSWDGATLQAGTSAIKIKALNASSVNVGEIAQAYTLDTTSPTTVVTGLAFSSDTGTSNTDFITKTTSQTIAITLGQATLDNAELVQVSFDGGTTWVDATNSEDANYPLDPANSHGSATWTLAKAFTAGSGTLLARVADLANNGSTPLSQAYTIDTTAPTITVSTIGIIADTGISSTDFKTSTAGQTITAMLSGTAAGNDKVWGSIDNGSNWIDITSMVSGTTLSWTGATLSGSSTIKIKVSDEAGNDGSIASQAYVLDTAAPTASVTTADVGIGSNVGTSQSSETGLIYLVPSGQTPADYAALEALVSGGTATKATVATGGSNTPLATTGLTSGTYKVWAVDTAGNISAASANTITLGTPPTTVVNGASLSADTGVSNTDMITQTAAQTISGTLSAVTIAGETIQVSLDNGSTWTNATNTTGQSTWSLAGQTLVGTNTLQVRVANAGGFASSPYSHSYTLDTSAPSATISTASLSADTGSSSTDLITNTAAQTISGTVSANMVAGEIVQVSLDNGSTWTTATTTTGQNTWSLSGQTLVGSNTLKVRVADQAGNTGTVASQAYVLDQIAPTVTFSALALSADTGASNTDFITRTAVQTITATLSGAPAGTDVVYGSLDNGTTWTNITNKVSGTTLTWNGVTLSGSSGVKIKVTDSAGNDGTVASHTYTLDTTAPGLNASGSSPADNATSASISTDLNVQFSEGLSAASDLTKVYLKSTVGGQVVPASFSIDGSGHLVIHPTAALSYSSGYYVNWDAAALVDVAGNAATAVNDQTTYNFTTEAAPPPPPPPPPAVPPITVILPNGTTTTVTPQPGVPTVVSSPSSGSTVSTSGTTDTTVSHPSGTVTLTNTGAGALTATGLQGDTTLVTTGTGICYVDIAGMLPGQVLTINNTGTGTVDLSNLPDGVVVKVLGTGPIALNDNDGAAASVENLAPPVTGGSLGDGNGDGTPDALQSNVASVPFLKTSTAITNPTGAAPVYISLVADSKDGKVDTTNAINASLNNVKQLDSPANLPVQVKMPLGLISFDSKVSTAGATESFSLYVDPTLGINAYWKQDSVGHWINLASSAYGGQVVTDGGKTRLDFKITDGGQFDSDGKADGVITDPGAPGVLVNTPPVIAAVPSTVQAVTTGLAAALFDFTVADAEQGSTSLSVTLTPTNGTINGLVDADASLAGIQLTGTASSINAAIAGATFTATTAGEANIGISVSDGIAAPVTAQYAITAVPPLPTDSDGIAATIEDAVPGLLTATGGAGLKGDGNGDSIPDSQQSEVASLSVLNSSSNPGGAATSSYLTLVADSNAGRIDTTDTNTASLNSVIQLDAASGLPAVMKMPIGLISFSAIVGTNGSAGVTETFSLYLDQSVDANGYWQQGSSGVWVNLASNVYGGQVVTEGGKTRLDFKITDGGEFDADHTVNGVVVDVGSAAHLPLTMVGYAPDAWVSLVGYAPALPANTYWF